MAVRNRAAERSYASLGASLVVQWLRVHLAVQGMWVQPLIGELRSDTPQSNQAYVPRLLNLRAATTKSVYHSKRSHMTQ